MALTYYLATCLLIGASLSEASSSLLQRSAGRSRAFAGLNYSRQDPAARTLLTLDTNQDGKIDPSEVAAFARVQGLDTAAATQEFSSIDLNGDGTLDSMELQKVLSPAAVPLTQVQPAAVAATDAAKVEPPQPKPAASSPTEALSPAAVAASTALAAAAVPPAPAPPAGLVSTGSGSSSEEGVELISAESRNSMRKAAQKVADELAVEEKEEKAARQFDREAAAFHANSEALVKKTTQDALDAGTKAAHSKADELMAQISKLEEQAEKAEVRAAALRAKAKMEMEEGNELMAQANQAMQGKSL